MSRRLIQATMLAAVAAVSAMLAGNAAAGSPKGVVLSAPKAVTVNYTHCFDATGAALPCITVDFTVTDYSVPNASCNVSIAETGFTAYSGVLSPGSSSDSEVTTAYTPGMKSVTLVLSCNGANSPAEKQRVRVLVA